ncbi:acyl-CoA reductase [Cellulophaga sp. E16_2]|uniref:acyl-CoA reductase n=1 Tax=Cellulophaga sp. E16_2 TaxID=2789297 RepID=UPI001A9248B0|nr:acyl-CoA reductase [Cellulophaga sp. E16_2]MBO0593816.1 acyl-CoA reductase [Cellulophaga sp. E16_2]
MTDHTQRIKAFVKLGTFFREFCDSANNMEDKYEHSTGSFNTLEDKIALAKHKNGWFTRENILFSFASWGQALTEVNLNSWLATYNFQENNSPKTVALILAGNIPLVGFHDVICVLLTGNKALIKLSSNDNILLPQVAAILINLAPEFKGYIQFENEKLPAFDSVIATGSNNTARYFEHYFKDKPHIIRKNRNSAAVLTGNETAEQLKALGKDIFLYYGLGCRSVAKLFVPKEYNFDLFFESLYVYHPIIEQAKYANNYDYNKAVYLMSNFKLLENGFLILKKDESYSSPIASLFYEEYETIEILKEKLRVDEEKIQCIVSQDLFDTEVIFGQTQSPKLTDYADNVDTIAFLLRNS